MKTQIDAETLLITKFKYSEPKNRGVVAITPEASAITLGDASTEVLKAELKRRRDNKTKVNYIVGRKTTCLIRRATSETESEVILEVSAQNTSDDQFSKAEGRDRAFRKALSDLHTQGFINGHQSKILLESFYEQCPSSYGLYQQF